MNKAKRFVTLIAVLTTSKSYLFSQQVDTVPRFTIGGYVDAYYAYYTDSVGSGKYQKFPAISPRSDAFGINVAQVTGQYISPRVRATVTLHVGDLPSAAWSPVFNYIQEANAGVRLAKNLWVDAGFFKTHIGTEALLPKDNITSSVSMITFFEPWWQSGVRLVYTPSDKISGAIYLVNGYNAFIPINKKKAAGLTITYNINKNFSVSYNNFLSDQTVDSVHTSHWRFLNNLVFNFSLGDKLKGVAGVDYILQQNTDIALGNGGPIDYTTSSAVAGTAVTTSFILTLKYQACPKFGFYGRFEYFNDPQGFMSEQIPAPNNSLKGLDPLGETLGIEYKPMDNAYIRLEGREIQTDANETIFRTGGKYVDTRAEVMLCIGAWF